MRNASINLSTICNNRGAGWGLLTSDYWLKSLCDTELSALILMISDYRAHRFYVLGSIYKETTRSLWCHPVHFTDRHNCEWILDQTDQLRKDTWNT